MVAHGAGAVEQLVGSASTCARMCASPPGLHPLGEHRAAPRVDARLFRAHPPVEGARPVIRALPAIARDVPDVRLVVAGDPIEPAELFQELARCLGVAGRIEWRRGSSPRTRSPTSWRKRLSSLSPYRKIESSGVLATALGYGRPAVVADVGSLGDTVREFGAGAVVPAENPSALAVHVRRCLRTPMRSRGPSGRRRPRAGRSAGTKPGEPTSTSTSRCWS